MNLTEKYLNIYIMYLRKFTLKYSLSMHYPNSLGALPQSLAIESRKIDPV